MTDRNSPLRRAFLLRHGQTAWNAEGRWQGRLDVPLDADGVKQAEHAAASLVRDTSIAVLVHSTSSRAAQTAAVVRSAFDLAGRPLRVSADERLQEVDMGEWSGLLHDEVRREDPDALARIDAGEDLRRGRTGETLGEATARVGAGFAAAVQLTNPGETLLVVSHGAVIRGLVADLTGITEVTDRRRTGPLGNCRWAAVREPSGADRWRLDGWNLGAM